MRLLLTEVNTLDVDFEKLPAYRQTFLSSVGKRQNIMNNVMDDAVEVIGDK